jgi:hypothetical protein
MGGFLRRRIAPLYLLAMFRLLKSFESVHTLARSVLPYQFTLSCPSWQLNAPYMACIAIITWGP